MQTSLMTKEVYVEFIRQAAKIISNIRKVESISEWFKQVMHESSKLPSSLKDMESDWNIARAFIGSKVIFDDGLHFIDLSSDCYTILERTWLHDIKKLRAYFLWQEGNNSSETVNFTTVCDKINLLLSKREAIPLSSFEETRDYIKNRYLTRNGTLDKTKVDVIKEIHVKAFRIWEYTRETNETKNWLIAESYFKKFYENIIPAIDGKSAEHIENLLNCFRNENGSDPFGIVNCFEALLVISFLDKKKVQSVMQTKNIELPL